MANIALLSWPLVSCLLFATLGREKGLIWAVIAGYLFLPENIGFALPGLPDYNKNSAISASVVLAGILFRRKRSWPNTPAPLPDNKRFGVLLWGLFVVLCLSAVLTVMDNGSALIDADRVRRGLSRTDLISMVSNVVIALVPFFLAWRWLNSEEAHTEVLRVIVILAMIYSVLALYEMRMSPQINRMVYGYFPHSWLQHVRDGSFRPVVFLQHGLWLAIFLLAGCVAAFGLFRQRSGSQKVLYLGAGLWLVLVLLISPNLGAAFLAFLFLPLLFLTKKIQMRVAMGVALVFLIFPSVRQADLLPLNGFLEFVSGISPARASSLEFRLENEDALLHRASQKPVFGWGGWGRWRVIDERGRDITVSDGLWIIILGARGWVGYLAYFGILVLPLLFLPATARRKTASPATIAISVFMAANLVYLVPNSALSAVGWLLSGAVAGFVSWRPVASEAVQQELERDPVKGSQYSRFSPAHPPTASRRR